MWFKHPNQVMQTFLVYVSHDCCKESSLKGSWDTCCAGMLFFTLGDMSKTRPAEDWAIFTDFAKAVSVPNHTVCGKLRGSDLPISSCQLALLGSGGGTCL